MKSNRKEVVLIDGANRQIPCQVWLPQKSKAQLVIIHGFSEHMQYYQAVAQAFCDRGIAVQMMDLPGHGMAEGTRGHIDRFDEYLDNVNLLRTANPHYLKTKPTFILGHSLGGLISALYCLRREHTFKGLILTSPLTGFEPLASLPIRAFFRFLAKYHRNIPIPKPVGVKALSRNPQQWTVYYSDPCRGRLISPHLYEIMHTQAEDLQTRAASLELPVLMFLAKKDTVVSPQAGQRFFANLASPDKSLVFFTEAMHELFQEVEWSQIVAAVHGWMLDRV